MTYEHVAGSRRYFAWAPNDYAVAYTVSARVGGHTLTPSQIQQRYHLAARGLFEDPPQRLIDFLNRYEETYGAGDHAQVRLVYSLDGHPQQTWTRKLTAATTPAASTGRPTRPGRLTLTSLNPFGIRAGGMRPNILLMTKVVTLTFLLSGQFGLLPSHFVPFIGGLQHLGSPLTFHRALQVVFLVAAVSLFLNRNVRLACVVLGGVILLGIASSMQYYENNRTYTALVLLLAGLQRPDDEPWLLQWQVIILYAGAALNKVLLADWRDGRFMDSWIGYFHQSMWHRVSRTVSTRAVGTAAGWAAIVTETVLAAGFLLRRRLGAVIWLGVAYHSVLVVTMNRTFGMFWFVAPASYLAFVTWPAEPLVAQVGERSRLLRRVIPALERLDLERAFAWGTAPGTGLTVARPAGAGPAATGPAGTTVTEKARGLRAALLIVLYNPLSYFVVAAVAATDHLPPRVGAVIVIVILAAAALGAAGAAVSRPDLDAVVVGSGPNGLAAAIALARAGASVLVLEARPTVGGGVRSEELTLPGYVHDVCSASYPFVAGSPFLRRLPLEHHGLEWIDVPPAAHPLDDGPAPVLERSVTGTAVNLGADAEAYRRLLGPLAARADLLFEQLLAPARIPTHPLLLARFGVSGIRSATGLIRSRFGTEPGRALLAGLAAHSILSLDRPASAAAALLMGASAHAYGWPLPRGGAQRLAEALADHLRSLGGQVRVSSPVGSFAELPAARAYLFDVAPSHLATIAGGLLPEGYLRRLRRYRHGPGVFKMDFALSAPIPWRAEECGRAGTVHLGGTLAEVAAAENEVAAGGHPPRPFVLLVQPSLFDDSRAPAGGHTAWAYCHVPNGSTVDMAARIEAQVERFAPGFRDCVTARASLTTSQLEARNANYVGGDIAGGPMDLRRVYARPVARLDPYSTPDPRIYLCSASTPPGGGVHGMCGFYAAESARRRVLGKRTVS